MPGKQITQRGKPYLNIVGGNFVQTVDKNTDGAKLREWELKDGTKGNKWELVYMNWSGIIQDIRFEEGDYGKMCLIDVGDAILSLNTSSNYFTDFASKLPNGDLKKEFLFHPFCMDNGDKIFKGISLQQNGEKLKNFYRQDGKNLHDFPQVNETEKEEMGKDYWKTYFIKVKLFLIKELQKLSFEKVTVNMITAELKEVDASTIPDQEDLPWEK
jgi:hypothetical protein